MAFALNIPRVAADPLSFTLEVGQLLFILGANGTGKSGLMQKLFRDHSATALRISAHRQMWFDSNTVNMTPTARRDTANNIRSSDIQPQSRWRDDYSAARSNMAIYDLIDAENIRARGIATAVDIGNMELAKALAKKDAPIKMINELLRLSNIPISISVRENEQIMASKNSGAPYSIAELSDGERNALLIAASVLTAKTGALILIDEPERHLHRSIISPLLTLLFAKRTDCAFVVSTHDVLLPIDNPSARTLLVRACNFSGNTAVSWDADLVASDAEINDDLKRDILGGRRKLLFVEGSEHSLDGPLYTLIFPSVSVIAKSGCRDVEHAVSGIRDADGLHWVHASGIVDNDRRTAEEISSLRAKGVYPIDVYSVESIYYHPEIQRRVSQRQALVTGAEPNALLASANTDAIEAIRPHLQRMSERAVERSLREEVFRNLPRREDITAGQPINIVIDVGAVVASERTRLEGYLASDDLLSILIRYPVRETPALPIIANRLGFQNRAQYEAAVRKLLMDDAQALEFVKTLFGSLPTDIAA